MKFWNQILYAPEEGDGGSGGGESGDGGGVATAEPTGSPTGGSLLSGSGRDTTPPAETPSGASGEATGATTQDEGDGYSPFSIYEEGKVSEKFLKTLGDEDKSIRKFFEKYAGAEDPNKAALQGLKNLQYLAGQKALEPLPEDAPDSVKQERQALLAKLAGAPEDPNGYGLDTPPEGFPETMEWPKEVSGKYAEVFHKYGAPPALVKELMGLEAQVAASRETAMKQEIQRTRDGEMEKLTSEFGDKTQTVLSDAIRGGATLGLSREEVEALATSASAVKALAKVVSLVGEDKLVNPQGNQGPIGQSYREQAQDILSNPANPMYEAYHNSVHPRHEEAVKLRSSLNQRWHDSQRRKA